MASSKDYLDFILEQLSELDEISHRAMMGEYVLARPLLFVIVHVLAYYTF